ncbi:MAG: hypothetical protein K2X01_05795 [Cyanobacteria bacterium]|nr:hypothetical protein [Cyanobacteriota bacterium]
MRIAAQTQQLNLQRSSSPLLLQPMRFQGKALQNKHVGFKARPITQWGSLLALLASLAGCNSSGFKPNPILDGGTQTNTFKNPDIIPLPDDFGALIHASEAKRPNPPKASSDWAPNVKVYASSSQAIASWFNPNEYSYFTESLMKRLKSASSLDAAYESMARYGYLAYVNPDKENPVVPPSSVVAGKPETEKKPSANIAKRFFPTATLRPNTAWKKAEQATPRFVLLLAEGSDSTFARNSQLVQDTLMDDTRGYGLCEENIKRFDKATPTEVEAGLKWLEQQVANNPKAEVLIYIASHGSPDYGLKPDTPEGSGYGFIGIGVSKTLLKQSIAQHLKAAKQVSIILDSCHAGNWIAMNPPKTELKAPST